MPDDVALAVREADEVVRIVRGFPDAPPGEAARARLACLARAALPGADGPGGDDREGARDAQFELFLRSELRDRGVGVRLASSGLVAAVDGDELPVEARRPASLEPAATRAEGEVVPGYELDRGVLALSLDLVVDGDAWPVEGGGRSEVEERVDRHVRWLMARNVHDLARRVEDRDVIGAVLVSRVPARIAGTGDVTVVTDYNVQSLAYTPAEERRLRALEGILDGAPRRP